MLVAGRSPDLVQRACGRLSRFAALALGARPGDVARAARHAAALTGAVV
jgi:hypothetical protein